MKEFVVDCCPYCEWIGKVHPTEDRVCWECGMELAGWQRRRREAEKEKEKEFVLPPLQIRGKREKVSCDLTQHSC